VDAARGGDPAALDRLVTVLARPVYQFGRTFCRNPDDAKDVMQEVLSAAVRTAGTAALRSSLTTWAYTVARNACSRMRRRRVGQPARFEPLEAAPAGPSDPSRDLERLEIREALRLALVALPTAHREAVLLCDVEELSPAEAARILGINIRALRSRLHRGRTALRAALGGRFRPSRAGAGTGEPCPESLRIQSLCQQAGRQRVPARVRAAVRRALAEQLRGG
jgi:RNA polymerase sigma-70 factor (ECF subfamily)